MTLAVLAFIYARRNQSFYFVRNMFIIAMALALIGYWLYPTAPPRLMPEWGFTDAISNFVTGGTSSIDDGPTKAFMNFYAAVPSMHVCFAVMIGGSMVRLSRGAPADRLVALSAARDVRGRGHCQPLSVDVFLGALTAGILRVARAEAPGAGQAGRLGVQPDPDARLTMPEQTQRPRARGNGAPRRNRPPRSAAGRPRVLRAAATIVRGNGTTSGMWSRCPRGSRPSARCSAG